MSSTFDTIANIIAERPCDIPRDSITPESHAINDPRQSIASIFWILRSQSTFEARPLPLEQWTQRSKRWQ